MKLWLVTFASIQSTQTVVSLGATAEEAIERIRTSCAIPVNAKRSHNPKFTATEITEGWRYVR